MYEDSLLHFRRVPAQDIFNFMCHNKVMNDELGKKLSYVWVNMVFRLHLGSGPSVLMHLGLNNVPFVPHVESWEPCGFIEAPDGPQAYALNMTWLQEK